MQTYGPLLRGGLDMALAQAETARQKASPAPGASGAKPEAMPAEAMKLVKLEARALVGILEDAASLRWDLSLETDAIRSESELTPRPGTALAELASMPAPTGPNPTRAIVGGGGLMSAAYQWDPKILTSFINRTLDSVAHDPEAAALLTPDVQSLVRSTMSWSTGYASVNMQGAPPAGLSSEMAMSVSDEAKVLETLEKATGLLSSGPVAQLYASMGLKGSGSVKRNVRRHAGVAVHRVNFDFGSKNVPAEQMALMKEMMKGMDVALTRGYYLASQDAAALDRMIDRVASGAAPSAPVELRAVATFGPGRHAYVDYDLVGLMRSMMSMLPKKPGDKPPVLPASGEPMTFAFGAGDGVLRAQARLPVRSFVEMTKSMSKAQGPAQKPKTP
jgi:hypothetical protein